MAAAARRTEATAKDFILIGFDLTVVLVFSCMCCCRFVVVSLYERVSLISEMRGGKELFNRNDLAKMNVYKK
jgi:hypothetical protein